MDRDQGADFWQQQQLEEERLREELDCLVVVHKHGLEGTAQRLAVHLGITKQFQQEIQNAAHK